MKFEELDLHKQVLSGIKAAGFVDCMPVQENVLPVSLTGRDVMVQSKTGSGKTAVYVLTFLEEYLRAAEDGYERCCLIIAPTRELAQQIEDDAKILCSKIPGFRIGCFVGGVGYEKQEKLLKKGCNLYVGTPGRLLEFMVDKKLDPQLFDTFVIDEADRMFDMGFFQDIKKMFRMMLPCTERQTMLFSATLEMRVRELAWEFMDSPVELELEPDTITVDSITQELYHVAKTDKFKLLLQLLTVEKPSSALIFTNSRNMTMLLSEKLKVNGFNASFISGDLSQRARERSLEDIKTGKISILVATDVAARGLQIDDLPLVVNYDIPEDYENYVHRIGRTARAGKSGKAITLADEEFVYGLEAIENYIKMKIPVIWPENLPCVEDKSANLVLKTSRHSSQKPGKKNSSGKKTVEKKVVEKKVEPKTDYKKLSLMSEEERMKFYAQKYGFEPASSNKKVSKPAQSAIKNKKTETYVEKETKTETKPVDCKKEGFLKKLFRSLF